MKKLFTVCLTIALILSINIYTAEAQWIFNINSPSGETTSEKPLIMRGLAIGTDIHEAQKIITDIMGKDWKITDVGERKKILADYRFGETEIFGRFQDGNFMDAKVGDFGFAIADKYGTYKGFISCDELMGKVTQITFSEKVTDQFFSISGVDVHTFVEALRKKYDMPAFFWIIRGWTYPSPHGYAIRIMTDKFFDVKKIEVEDDQKSQSDMKGIRFD